MHDSTHRLACERSHQTVEFQSRGIRSIIMLLPSWAEALEWIGDNRIGDVASIAGVLISTIGFVVTIANVVRTKAAAVKAEEASSAVHRQIREFESVFDFSTAISALEEIKRLHRQNAWHVLPDRYAALRKTLLSLRANMPSLPEKDKTIIQDALVNLRDIERRVERSLSAGITISPAKFNNILSEDIDNLVTLLTSLKSSSRAEAKL
jgi:hypothetical protein